MQMDTLGHVHMWTHPSACICAHACTADSLTDRRGACSGTHTFRDTHRRRLWEVESESSRPELWVVLLS